MYEFTEIRSVELNCAETLVATSMERDGLKLAITEEEQLGPDGFSAEKGVTSASGFEVKKETSFEAKIQK